MEEHIVANVDEVPEGDRIVVQLKGRDIGLFNIDGQYFAYTNWCPHQGGPICQGKISGTTDGTFDPESLSTEMFWTKEGEIVVCPWHGWEFDLKSGKGVHDENTRLPSYPVDIKDGKIVVSL